MKVNAVIVTYNRKGLLEECLNSLLSQTYKLNKIVVLNNASTDGTDILLKEKFNRKEVEVVTLSKNMGGSGGFYYGMKKTYKDCDFVWAMDDDTIPTPTALEELVKAKEKLGDEKISFLASTVYGMHDDIMNLPEIDNRELDNGFPDWPRHLKDGIVKIKNATLVSLLISSDAINKVGAPHPYYFIWGDDIEFTLRLTKYYGPAYMVGSSKVIHKRFSGEQISIHTDTNLNRIKMYKYLFRNCLVNAKYYYSKQYFKTQFKSTIKKSFSVLFKSKDHRFLRFKTVQKAIFEYLNGSYDKKAFDNRFNNVKENYLDELEVK